MNPQELKERTKQFALGVMRLIDALPRTPKANALAGQLVRSGTSVAAKYRAACRGGSRAEFICKIGVVEEEADETAWWLELIIDDRILSEKKVAPLLSEANEVVAIWPPIFPRRGASREISNQQSAIKN
jgi:four helix bundle protein